MRSYHFRHLIAATAAAALMTGSVQRSAAGDNGLAAALVGAAIIGTAIHHANTTKNKPAPTTTKPSGETVVVVGSSSNTHYSAARAANRELQLALVHFDFPAGSPDGVLGRKYRTAASGLQTYLGHPVSGALTDFEKDILLGAYERSQEGNADTLHLVSTSPDGARGLLLAQRDILTGTDTPVRTADGGNSLTLFNAPANVASVSAHCAKVRLRNGGGALVNVAASSDPGDSAGALLCDARDNAVAYGDALAGQLGVTLAQVDSQCAEFGPAMTAHVASLSLKPRAEMTRDVGSYVADSGMDGAQLRTTAEVCLASGYRLDDMDVALGSALLLVALGDAPYGELMGHHLSLGLSTNKRVDYALDWYDATLSALDAGSDEVFDDVSGIRVDLLRATATRLAGGEVISPKPVEASLSKNKLPTFGSAKKSK